MAIPVVRFINIVLAGLMSGIMLGIWMGYNPATFTYQTYLESQQGAIESLNTIMPLLGLLAIVSTLASAFMQKSNKTFFSILIIAAILLIVAGVVTRFANQPINATVMTWNAEKVPTDWVQLRDKWWTFHQTRTLTTIIAFFLVVWTVVGANRTR
jgi:hypothetical protein